MAFKLRIVDNVLLRESTTPNAIGSIWCIHAFADSGLAYMELLSSKLNEQFNLYVPDFPGFGISPLKSQKPSLEEASKLLINLIRKVSGNDTIFIIAHSVGGIIGTRTAQKLTNQVKTYFNIEGNLTAQDAYFSGQAVNFDTPAEFKEDFLQQVYKMAKDDYVFKRYFASVCQAQPQALMGWGKSSAKYSDNAGEEFLSLSCSKRYYWCENNTSDDTQRFIKEYSVPNRCFYNEGHWPFISQPDMCSKDILDFFLQ